MRRITLVLAAAAAVLSTTAVAQIGPGFGSKGECSKAIAWAKYDARKGIPNPYGVLSPGATCEKIGALWYIVDDFADG